MYTYNTYLYETTVPVSHITVLS